MSAASKGQSKSAETAPMIHEASRASGSSGAVGYGAELSYDAAVERRRQGEDVVVRGHNKTQNRRKAGAIEAEVGKAERHSPHPTAGPQALPHYQQVAPPPKGHT